MNEDYILNDDELALFWKFRKEYDAMKELPAFLCKKHSFRYVLDLLLDVVRMYKRLIVKYPNSEVLVETCQDLKKLSIITGSEAISIKCKCKCTAK